MAHKIHVSKKVARIKFKPVITYFDLKLKFREEFNKKWENEVPSPETGLEGYTQLTTLGTGAFGRVVLVEKEQSYYAVKVLIKEEIVKAKRFPHVYSEKQVLSAICFPFLINLEFSSKDFDCLYLGMPFINGSDLFAYHRKVRKFGEKKARFYAAQVCLGLEYLHFLNVLYRDLKPENILINSNGYIKITSFGFAKKVESRTLTLCGTPEYMAPEVIQTKPYGSSVDWWSFGILIYELVAGRSPFSQYNHDVMSMYSKICECDYKMPINFSDPLKDLISQLLQIDITKRLGTLPNGVNDIKDHPWFKSVDWHLLFNQNVVPPHIPQIVNKEEFTKLHKSPDIEPITKSETNRHADLFSDF